MLLPGRHTLYTLHCKQLAASKVYITYMFVYVQNNSYLSSSQVSAFVVTMNYINTTMIKFISLYESIMTHNSNSFLADEVQYVYSRLRKFSQISSIVLVRQIFLCNVFFYTRPVCAERKVLDDASLRRGVPWLRRSMDESSICRSVPGMMRPLDDVSLSNGS
jgi:Ulp1 family protease